MLSTVLALGPGVFPECAAAQGALKMSDAERDEATYRDYQRANLNLRPLYQIEAWLGYLRLHPHTPHRDQLRWRLRYLAATLGPQEDAQLLAILAFQQLPDRLIALETPELRRAACGEYIVQFPELFTLQPYDLAFQQLLTRLNVEEPHLFIAQHLNGTAVGGVMATASTSTAPSAPGEGLTRPEAAPMPAQPAPERDTTVASLPPSAGSTAASPAAPSEAAAPGTGVAPAAAGTPPASTENVGAPGSSTAVAMVTPSTGATPGGIVPETLPSPQEDARREAQRYPRWIASVNGLSPEATRQMWLTYLLLYPDTPHVDEIGARIAEADRLDAEQKAQMSARDAELAAARQQQADLERRLESLEHGRNFRRALLSIGGGILLLIMLAAI